MKKYNLIAMVAILPTLFLPLQAQVPVINSNSSAILVSESNIDYKPIVITKPKIDFDTWLNKLIEKECNNPECHEYGYKIVDVNNKYSYGCLQFQMPTWLGYSRKYGLGYTENDIYDCEKQKVLAKLILYEPGGWKNWYTSIALRGLGLPPL